MLHALYPLAKRHFALFPYFASVDSLVSILVPSYNFAAFLPECLASVLAQTHSNWECIVVDDGSTDTTREVMQPFLKDKRFRYVYQQNQGLSATRNTALALARGDYIQLLDADDRLMPEKLHKQVEQLKNITGPCLSISDFTFSDPAKKRFNRFQTPQYLKEFILRVSIPPVCFLFSKHFFTEHGLKYDATLSTHEDWDMMIRILKLQPAVRICDEVLAWYRIHNASMTSTLNMRAGLIKVIDQNKAAFANDPDLFALFQIRKRLTRLYYSPLKPISPKLHALLLRYAVWKYL